MYYHHLHPADRPRYSLLSISATLQEEIQMVHQLNELSMHQQLQKPLCNNMLDEYHIQLNDAEKEPLALNKHSNSASHQGVIPITCYSPQEQQRIIKPHQRLWHIARLPEVTSPLQANAVKEGFSQ